jgi:hypothetical protein
LKCKAQTGEILVFVLVPIYIAAIKALEPWGRASAILGPILTATGLKDIGTRKANENMHNHVTQQVDLAP